METENLFYAQISDRLAFTGEWRSCCDDPLLPNEIWDRLKLYRELCSEEFPYDKHCALFCMASKFKEYDSVNGFNTNLITEMIGSKGVVGGEKDWKKKVADQIVKQCFSLVHLKPNDKTRICNTDISLFGNCYIEKMIDACPANLKNPKHC